MKHVILFSVLMFCLGSGILAQTTNKKQNLPKENSKVTREYDEKGNLIKFDSVYSYSFSSDSTLVKDFSPKDFPGFFGPGLGFTNDSTFNGKSFFDDFDKMFADPFGHFDAKQDSVFLKHFGGKLQFHQFNDNDSTTFSLKDFDDMFGNSFESKKDSSSVKRQEKIARKSQPRSMEEMMQMFQQQFKEIEKQRQQFFNQNPNQKEF